MHTCTYRAYIIIVGTLGTSMDGLPYASAPSRALSCIAAVGYIDRLHVGRVRLGRLLVKPLLLHYLVMR